HLLHIIVFYVKKQSNLRDYNNEGIKVIIILLDNVLLSI
ncbi:MAG: hypothetical protein K0S04_4528, partial [Herbinix sp.]|nr:hypothetical protein [Herbinix sp.]